MNIENLRPLHKNVLIKAYEWPDRLKSGLYMPDMMKYSPTKGGKDPWRGEVIAIGSEVKQIKVGEIVRYQPDNYFKQTIDIDGIRYITLEEILIYAVEDKDENLTRALRNRVVLEPEELEEKHGSIYLPQIRKENILYGRAIVVGENVDLKSGDRVAIENKSTWQYYNSNGKCYILTDKSNLLAKLNND